MKQASQAANIVYYFLEYDENFWKRSVNTLCFEVLFQNILQTFVTVKLYLP